METQVAALPERGGSMSWAPNRMVVVALTAFLVASLLTVSLLRANATLSSGNTATTS
jgi:hypothetical protein